MSIINTPTGVVDGQTDEGMKLTLTPREELAVIYERLKKHISECTDETAKTKLEIANGLIREATFRR